MVLLNDHLRSAKCLSNIENSPSKGADEALWPFFLQNNQYPVHLPISCKFSPTNDSLTVLPIQIHTHVDLTVK